METFRGRILNAIGRTIIDLIICCASVPFGGAVMPAAPFDWHTPVAADDVVCTTDGGHVHHTFSVVH